MNRLLTTALILLCALVSLKAQSIVAVDTIAYTATQIVAEPDPNNGEYTFALLGTDTLGNDWKAQINYHADSMYGTFTDSVFDLTGTGKSFNWLRKPDNDTYVRFFKHIDATISDLDGATVISVNALIQDYGEWKRVLIEGVIPAPAPLDTIETDLGVVAVVPNTFFGSLIMEAQNAAYSLEFGVMGRTTLAAGTYYRTELIRPDFVRASGDTIKAKTAQLEVSNSAVQGQYDLMLDLLSTADTLYRIAMHTTPLVASDTIVIRCEAGQLIDMTSTYGLYQIYGESTDYNVALSVRPAVIEKSMLTIPQDSIYLDFTTIALRQDLSTIRVQQAEAIIVPDTADAHRRTIYADLFGADGILYQVSWEFGNTSLTAAADTIDIQCGDYVGRLDYTGEPGWLGLVLGNDDADIHATFYNGYQMTGFFTNDYFSFDNSYVTTYSAEDSLIRFSNVGMAECRMDSIGDTLLIRLDAITVSNIMYRFTARLLPLRCMTGDSVSYTLDINDEVDMVALRTAGGNQAPLYKMQLRHADSWTAAGEPVGDYEMWTFAFEQDSVDGVAGKYGYAAGTLDATVQHTLYEKGTEVYLAALAGTLTIDVVRSVTVNLGTMLYRTHIYQITSRFVGVNNMLYSLSGANVLVCADYDSGQLVELTETELSDLETILGGEGLRVRKVLRNGMILLETEDATYTPTGQRVR